MLSLFGSIRIILLSNAARTGGNCQAEARAGGTQQEDEAEG